MKKTYLLMAAIFLTFIILIFTACQIAGANSETVTFIFPAWPPQEDLSYPNLDCWLVEIEGPDISQKFYSNSRSIEISVQKNIPCSVTATPVTEKMIFFKPAGIIYPYYSEYENGKVQEKLTWECGYAATLMQRIYRSKIDTGVTSQHIMDFQKSFNWKKLQDSIQNKCDSQSDKFYNPWQLDTRTLLDNLCYAAFSANYLNTKNILSIPLENAGLSDSQKHILSCYIPENQNIQNKGILTLRKNQTELYMYNQIYAAEINCSSSKKVSVAFTYLPILY